MQCADCCQIAIWKFKKVAAISLLFFVRYQAHQVRINRKKRVRKFLILDTKSQKFYNFILSREYLTPETRWIFVGLERPNQRITLV